MIYPWQWAWFILRRFVTLLVCVVKPHLEREYLKYENSVLLKSVLRGKFQTGTYQQAINRVVIDKHRLLLFFINSSSLESITQLKQFIENENVDEELVYFVVEVDDYYGWLLACKLQVFSVPTTLLIGPGNVGPRIMERYSHKLFFFLNSSPNTLKSATTTTSNPAVIKMTLMEEQAMAFERSMQTDLLRQRQKQSLKEREENYLKLLSESLVSASDADDDVFKLALQMPDGKRVNKLVKAEAPLAILFAIARARASEDGEPYPKSVIIKTIDPSLTFNEEDENVTKTLLADSGLYRMQKLFVEWEN